MSILRTLSFTALLALASFGVSSCLNPPDYPETPSIEFKSITQKAFDDPNNGVGDTIRITVSFKDGDGDLGVGADDNVGTNNYFCTLQLRNASNVFEDYKFSANDPGYNGRYPVLTPASQGDKKAPLRGDLTFRLLIYQGSFPRNSVVRFRVRIADRALNESNEVFTDAITLR
ncbi:MULTISPECIES: hypothetical protein [Hymenobacter]|uniref:hypothetical protein n=1 Tax=Hymenobacter TaxID=89966 RepID=UPI0005F16294|nr:MULTISPECIES: hypothetical protein [Hymenobacter]